MDEKLKIKITLTERERKREKEKWSSNRRNFGSGFAGYRVRARDVRKTGYQKGHVSQGGNIAASRRHRKNRICRNNADYISVNATEMIWRICSPTLEDVLDVQSSIRLLFVLRLSLLFFSAWSRRCTDRAFESAASRSFVTLRDALSANYRERKSALAPSRQIPPFSERIPRAPWPSCRHLDSKREKEMSL